MLSPPLLLRLAVRLQRVWSQRSELPDEIDLNEFDARVEAFRRAQRRHRLARSKSLGLIEPGLQRVLQLRLDDLRRSVEELRLECIPAPVVVPDLAEWIADLRQLEEEFGDLLVRWNESVLRAVTEPITLKGVELGRFALELHWKNVGSHPGASVFAVLALEPNPAGDRDSVTHPHVRDDRLCPGDAAAPIERALAAGRIGDAFLLMRSVLLTYNPSSPFVPLAEWNARLCSDCGGRIPHGEHYSCGGCENELCDSCSRSCASCESNRCGECLDHCTQCLDSCCPDCLEVTKPHERLCAECLGSCSDCGERFPKKQLANPERLCPTCITEESDDDDDDDPTEVPEPATEVATG